MKLRFWDVLSILGLLGILLQFAIFGIIFVSPGSFLNPFPPPNLPDTIIIPTATGTHVQLPPTWTQTPAPNDIGTATLASTQTLPPTATGFQVATFTYTATYTFTPSDTPTPTTTYTPSKTFTITKTKIPSQTFTVTISPTVTLGTESP